MGTPLLTERDEALLNALRDDGPADAAALATATGADEADLASRLDQLGDAGLVERDTDERAYVLTADGRRVLEAPGDGSSDERIDTPDSVERALESLDLRPDRERAVRRAFAFLVQWGDATAAEIRDALYEECPAGYASPTAWWERCVEPALKSLPGVTPPESDLYWWFESDGEVEDGRRMLDAGTDEDATDPADVGADRSVRRAVACLDCSSPECDAVRAAFALLYDRGEVPAEAFTEEVYSTYDAHYGVFSEWWRAVSSHLASLPGVEAPDDIDGRWRYERPD